MELINLLLCNSIDVVATKERNQVGLDTPLLNVPSLTCWQIALSIRSTRQQDNNRGVKSFHSLTCYSFSDGMPAEVIL